ncbi:hypothetical protein MPTK1_4g16240 [Marchantia polymorpha subsp. ruderalis]|uniref:Major facilitator superfamily (MFS) profile domain-containing protein n=1 Tax=Marchantia polymorpha TaxID=3197 RepID=A0A2R6WVV8_MARPO|nr:hypothetical protein MARPO_0054s0089 [Marchantia polymorpha]|eukprot:PTQ37982.1 hypothetical protein MARPO_0054s0089 [Marchantia polymorpha]
MKFWRESSSLAPVDSAGDETALERYTQNDTVDCEGRPANKATTGGWRCTPFIFGAEFAEKTAAFGAQFNMVNYLVGVKFLAKAYSANMVTNYLGTGYLMTLVGGIVADSFLGRFWTIFAAGTIQMMGFVVLMLTAFLPSLNNQYCEDDLKKDCRAAHGSSLSTIYVGLYLIAIGTGGIKACVSAFGADQFDSEDPREAKSLPHYFNVFFGSVEMGSLFASTLMIWIQEYKGWKWGYAILAIVMGAALVLLVSARRLFRYRVPRGSPFTPVARVFITALRNRKLPTPTDQSHLYTGPEEKAPQGVIRTSNLKFLEKAAVLREGEVATGEEPNPWRVANLQDVEDTKMLLRLLPILFSSFFYWTCSVQFSTFTVYQVATMDRRLGTMVVPSGTVGGVFLTVSILLTIIFYDRVIMRLIKRFTGNGQGISPLRKIGIGVITPAFAMMTAALIEMKRLRVVQDEHAEDSPATPLPMSMFWLVPQYLIIGSGQAFIYVGSLEFFYNESPRTMQSLGTALVSCTMSIGVFTSSAIVSTVNRATRHNHDGQWLGNNLNRSHLDRFYWVLGGLSLINVMFFLLAAWWHESVTRAFSSSAVAADPDASPPSAAPSAHQA